MYDLVGKIKEMTMRYLIVLFLILAFVVGCGCSNVLTPPALAANAKDIWPALYGVAANGADEGHFIVYDQLAGAWQAPRLIANDLLALQWTPQRNSVGWLGGAVGITGGTYNVSFIEDTSNDLEIWNSPDDGWQDDGGAWGLLDDDASQDFFTVDVETRQNYAWLAPTYGAITIESWNVDLVAGVPALAFYGPAINAITPSNLNYSIVLDDTLYGIMHVAHVDATVQYSPIDFQNGRGGVVVAAGDYPQVITDNSRLWVYYTVGNTLAETTSTNRPSDWVLLSDTIIYTATGLTADYHATWLAYDDTIHVVLCDFINNVSTTLYYLRRTPNGWSAPIALLAVDSSILGDHEILTWPQITVDTFGNIFVYYILGDLLAGNAGDLQGFYLDVDDYDNPVVGNWTQHLNIDQSADLVKWVVAPDSVPISMEM